MERGAGPVFVAGTTGILGRDGGSIGSSSMGMDLPEAHVVLAFVMVCVHRPDPKKESHLLRILRHRPVKNKNIASIRRINPQFAKVDPVDSPKLIVIAIILSNQKS